MEDVRWITRVCVGSVEARRGPSILTYVRNNVAHIFGQCRVTKGFVTFELLLMMSKARVKLYLD